MTQPSPPTFDEWVHYCFWQGHGDFSGTSWDSEEAVEQRERRFCCNIDPIVLAQHMTRLFESPGFIMDRYTDPQIAAATWFIFGCGSGYFGAVFSKEVPEDLQVRCCRSVATLYTDLFDCLCGRRGADPDTDLREELELDGAVYMIWDMDGGIELPVMFPKDRPHLVEPGIGVLQTVLGKCRTSACLISALHGIGHIHCIHNYQGDKAIARRMQAMIDAFVAERQLPEWISDYAAQAREGNVQ